MRRPYIMLVAVIVLCSFTNIFATQDQVIQAANNGLQQYLKLIPAGSETQYGFLSRSEVQNATVGKPLQALALNADFYNKDYVPGTNYLVVRDEWRVPVIFNNEYKTLLTVANDQNNLKVVDLGGAGLSRELQTVSASLSKDDNFYILRIYPLSADFFVDVKSGDISMTNAVCIPLSSAIMAIPSLQQKSTYTLNEILPIIKTTLTNSTK